MKILTLNQMFDVTAQLVVNNQEENPWSGQNSVGKDSWNQLSLIGDETIINLFNILNATKLGRTEL